MKKKIIYCNENQYSLIKMIINKLSSEANISKSNIISINVHVNKIRTLKKLKEKLK